MSTASTATAGAVAVLALLPSDMCRTSRSRPSGVRTYSTRNGCTFAAVGGHLARSQMLSSSRSVTGVGAKLFAVLASVNRSARPASSSAGSGCGAGACGTVSTEFTVTFNLLVTSKKLVTFRR